MSVGVLIPWRTTSCPHRTRALEYVLAHYATTHPDWPVVIGRHNDGAWCKATATAGALSQTQATVLILADADCVAEGLAEAVEAVHAGAPWAIPHRGVHRLDEAGTARWIARDAALDGLPLAERPYLGVEGGGVTVIRRDVYIGCPLDARFLGWGSEDDALGMALRTLHGPPVRVRAPLIHLWHPPQERATRSFGSMQSRDLRKRYARAQHNPAAMRALIEEVAPCRSQAC